MRFVDKETEKLLREIIIYVLNGDTRLFRTDILYTTEEILAEIWKYVPDHEHFKVGLVLAALCREKKVPFTKMGETTSNLSYFQYNIN